MQFMYNMYNNNTYTLLRSAILYAGNQTKRKKRTAGSDYYGLISKGERVEKIEKEEGASVRAEIHRDLAKIFSHGNPIRECCP